MWYQLVHVCRRWRLLVFASPRRLDLHLSCTDNTPVREALNIWPPLPIEIWSKSTHLGDDIIAALEYPYRVRNIWFFNLHSSPALRRLVTTTQKPFPELESLHLGMDGENFLVLPNTFLGGSAPRLRSLTLKCIPFPTLPKLLLSSNYLVDLTLDRIPRNGYILPETMAESLSGLTRLSYLFIGFNSPASFPDRRTRHPPPPTRAVLPALTRFWFHGINQYLEDLVAQINAPLLHTVDITLFSQPVFDTQQLRQFIGHAPMLMPYNQAKMDYKGVYVAIKICPSLEPSLFNYLGLKILCCGVDLQVSSMAQMCNQIPFLVSRIEKLYIQAPSWLLVAFRDMVSTQWLELFHPFTAVQALHLSSQFRSPIVLALQGLSGEPVAVVLPALVDLYLEGYQASRSELQDIKPFITTRQHSGYPVVVHRWNRLWHE